MIQGLFPSCFQYSSLTACIILAVSPFNPASASSPIKQALMHAQSKTMDALEHDESFKSQLNGYLASEKLDGIRAIWTGSSLVTRQGNPIFAPTWFTDKLPQNTWLEGELWVGRQQFQLVSSIVRDHTPNENEWRKVKFMIFDSPYLHTPFKDRLKTLEALIPSLNLPFVQLLAQYEINHLDDLESLLESIESRGGEGVMLHQQSNLYQPGRNPQLIKVKSFTDSEAVVVGYEPGKGKYQGLMGAIWVVTPDNKRFKIGSGFSDNDRQRPPALGSIIQYRFSGFTDSGLPRFARYLRERNSPDT
ncbi:DNA ligase [Photobacterium rosenbergii]|uniref:DNA ligase n=1 Tax=Photobacterium rosenbergii TaxID=294936 RepID=A0ABU3ZJ82_9GAMM|nr:DNA ligase [Photobacterium rosenbergii]MDV5170166.1 DNA ligase [Photobacterium rosenbergii]